MQALHEAKGVRPYAVHATWVFGGVDGKRARMRDMGLWADPPAYYETGDFVALDLAVPEVGAAAACAAAGQEGALLAAGALPAARREALARLPRPVLRRPCLPPSPLPPSPAAPRQPQHLERE